ncbi:MAG: sugar phosphotransferase [Chitinophagaceae bacterium]|nr:sugar phosphotransferase [Chitinophagaceae bacterium]
MSNKADAVVIKLISAIKHDMVDLPRTTIQINGIDVPQWLPEGADQAATLILGLIPYCQATDDVVIKNYIRKLADGIVMTQFGDAAHFPYSCFLSSGATWHAYGSDQASAIFKAGNLLNDTFFINKAMLEVNNFYPWLLNNGLKNSFVVNYSSGVFAIGNEKDFEQIAYGIRPMVFAAIDAYIITNDDRYADMAGHLAAWFFGKNTAATNMFSINTGRCYDAINTGNSVNKNSGAESTIEALLTMQRVSNYPAVKAAMDRYKL